MANTTLVCGKPNTKPVARQTLSASTEYGFIVDARACPGTRAVIQIQASTGAFNFDTVSTDSVAGGFPVSQGQTITLTFQDGDVFYLGCTTNATVDFLSVSN